MRSSNLSVIHLATQDIMGGGAFTASRRLHQAFLENDVSSQMYVSSKKSDLHTVVGNSKTKFQKLQRTVKLQLAAQIMRLQNSPNLTLHSPAIFPSGLTKKLNAASVDILHLHWFLNEFISIEEIGRFTKPLVWTLYDMWPFSGAEHYDDDGLAARWRVGYQSNNRPPGHKGIDIDRWVWSRKFRAWKVPIHVIAPTQWMADCARNSVLMRNWPISIIPYSLDTTQFSPCSKVMARKLLGLPQGKQIVLFGAVGGGQNPRKGWDLLQSAMTQLSKQMSDLVAVVFGESEPKSPPRLGMQIYWMGHIYDEITLALLYSAADVMVVPSRQEAFGQTGSEAQSCGCPVVAFNASGLSSVVVHRETGYLAIPFEVDDLARGIAWVLGDVDRSSHLSQQARDRAVRIWTNEVIVKQHVALYEQMIDEAATQIQIV
jgi:glycosyltransferase involved in cell wall biosynthesis